MVTKDLAIEIEGLRKSYRIWGRPGSRLRALVREALQRQRWLPGAVRPGVGGGPEAFEALKPMSLRLGRGETFGVVGRNGSGKSTLLRLIAGTLRPSAGTVKVHGRLGALLELGAGFNPEFTGRENVYLNAALLGLTRAEVKERFAEVEAFAGIGRFMEQPVKTYSSGMTVRLGFAVQTMVDPEVLLIDEALAVGDAPFVRKCFARLERLKAQGTTILFVSHDMGSVLNLCDRAGLLHEGELILVGKPKRVVEAYLKTVHSSREVARQVLTELREAGEEVPGEAERAPVREEKDGGHDFDPKLQPESQLSYASRGAEIIEPRVLDERGHRVNLLRRRQWYRFAYRVRFDAQARDVAFAMLIKTQSGQELGGARSHPGGLFLEVAPQGSTYAVEFRFQCLLTSGYYFLNAGVEANVEGKRSYAHRLIDAAVFRVLPEAQAVPTVTVDFLVEPSHLREGNSA